MTDRVARQAGSGPMFRVAGHRRHGRSTRRPLLMPMPMLMSLLVSWLALALTACSGGGGGTAADTSVAGTGATASPSADTGAPNSGSIETGAGDAGTTAQASPPEVSTTIPTTTMLTTSTSTTTTSTTTTSTTTTTTTTTIPHGPSVATALADGTPIPPAVLSSVQAIYAAALVHDYDRLRTLVSKNFRSDLLGAADPVAGWQQAFLDGDPDPLARLVRLLETPPGQDDRGNIVYPYVAIKAPESWDGTDEGVLAGLGFDADTIAATKAKGRYLDERVVFLADGTWRAFAPGR